MPDKNWTKRFAFYSASQLRLGNVIEAGFAAAILFEKYIEDELGRLCLKRTETGDFLFDAIQQLEEADSHTYNASHLHTLRKIRNKNIIHCDDNFENYDKPSARQQLKSEIHKLVKFVWERLDTERFTKYRTIESIPHIHADFAVMGVREFYEENVHRIDPGKSAILLEDFDDLIHMRRHFLQLGEFVQKGMLKKYRNLEVDLVSHVDTSSGYVWLAVNHKRPAPDHLRDRIRHSSISVFATPLDLRISIDFGGEDYWGRKDYYKFLATEDASEFLTDAYGFSIIGLQWYSFVTSCEPAPKEFTSQEMQKRLSAASDMLKRYKNEGRIVTWERLLLGYVLRREPVTYASIADRMERIIQLYYRFEKYRKDVLERQNCLDWVPEGM